MPQSTITNKNMKMSTSSVYQRNADETPLMQDQV